MTPKLRPSTGVLSKRQTQTLAQRRLTHERASNGMHYVVPDFPALAAYRSLNGSPITGTRIV